MNRFALVAVFLSTWGLPLLAQAPAQGSPMYGSFDGDSLARVNLQNLNVDMIFPIAGNPGRGLDAAFALSYNSSIWSSGWTPVFNDSGAATWGWNRFFFVGHVDYSHSTAHCNGDPHGLNQGTTTYFNFAYVSPDGTRHPFTINYHIPGECGGTSGGTYTGYATDGSGFYIDANQGFVRDHSGITLTGYGTGMEDTNGNFISSVSSFNSSTGQTTVTWTDSRGKTALQTVSPNPSNTLSDGYSYYDSTGNFKEVLVQNQNLNVATHFGCAGQIEYSGTAKLPTSITFANGQSYAISYEPTPGVSGSYTGRIQKIVLATGGYIQFTYGGANSGINCLDGSTVNLSVARNDGASTKTTQYVRTQVGGLWQTQVTYPQMPFDAVANNTVVGFDVNGREITRKIYQGNAAGNPLQTTTTAWATNGTPASKTVILEDGTTASLDETSYDSFGNVLSLTEHDWGSVAVPGSILKTTTLTYTSGSAYTNLNILDRMSRMTIADGTGVTHFRVDITYDSTPVSPCPTGVAQHDDTNHGCGFLTRGNATSKTTYINAATPSGGIVKNFQYDVFGNLVQADLNCCQVETWLYSAVTNYAFPDSTTRGSTPTQLTTSTTYNLSDGSVSSVTDENGRATTYAYDLMGRVQSITRPDSTKITYTYDDANNAITVSTPVQGAAAVQQKSTLDGFGRAIKTSILDATNNSYSIIETQFDPLNRPYKVSNPHNSTAQYWTESDFDALGRPTVVIPPDGTSTANNTKYTYTTNSVIVTDPSGKARKQQIDGLGRTVKSLEPDVTNGNSLTQDTEMTYSVLDRLMSTTQGSQIRTYGYDDLGRLLSVKTPEANQVVTSYTYNNFDLMTQRTDARGVKTSYTYDLLNRPYQMLYDVGATGVPATAPVTFTYDQGGAAQNALGRLTTVTDGVGTEQYTYNSNKQITQVNKVIGGTTYATNYAYNLLGQLASITYPSGRFVQENYDAIGRLCGVGTATSTCTAGIYANQILYNFAGQVTSLSFGNGVTAAATYSADRLQMTGLSYAKGTQTLLSLGYFYKNNVTSCPGGTTANNGQIQCITDGVDSGRSEAMAYDAIGRVSVVGTNGSTGFPRWQLSFAYDRYGNRTAETVTAGTGPGSSVSISATTNHITGTGYSYDANGNMTGDGSNTLTYDAENRVLTSSGSLGSGAYTYDGKGYRVKKTSSGATTVYIFSGSKVIAEYVNGVAPSSPTREYVYAAGLLLAKVEGTTTNYYHSDHQSIRLTTDSSGNLAGQQGEYPFGESWYLGSTTSKWMFTGYERDGESGNDYAMARTYVSRLARFSSLDEFSGSASDPQSLNRYSYVENDPTNNTDPSGKLMIPGRGWVSWGPGEAGFGSNWGDLAFSNIRVTGFGFIRLIEGNYKWGYGDIGPAILPPPTPDPVKILVGLAKELAKKKFDKKKCAKDLAALGVTADQVRAGALAANITNGVDSQVPLADLYRPELKTLVSGTVGERLAKPGTVALASMVSHDIYVNPGMINSTDYYGNEGIDFHEVIHNITGMTDPDIQRKLGLPESDDTSNITNKLIKDCL